MYFVAEYIAQVTQFTPSLMMSLIVAMSIDYSLFLLSRFIEDFANLQDKTLAIAQMVKYSGRKLLSVFNFKSYLLRLSYFVHESFFFPIELNAYLYRHYNYKWSDAMLFFSWFISSSSSNAAKVSVHNW
jgi:hypothetical protein